MPENYNRTDYLTAKQLAEKWGYTTEDVEKVIKKLRFSNATIRVSTGLNRTRPCVAIYQIGGANHVHPLAQELVKQALENQKGN